MKNLLFILETDYSQHFLSGMRNKVYAQKMLFENNDINCHLYVMDNSKSQYSVISKILKRLPFFNISPKWKYNKSLSGYNVVYMRRPFYFSCYTICTIRQIKKNNRNCTIIIEIPTYPYDGEYKISDIPLMIKDKIWRRCLYRYVDYFAVVGTYEYIPKKLWGIKTVPFENGVNTKEIKTRKNIAPNNAINLLAISSMSRWHGYERVIIGLDDYYKNGGSENVHIYFVGEGGEKKYYQKLCEKKTIKEKVHFLGLKCGDDLMDVVNKYGDIGLCSFGRYKSKMKNSTDLKSREYLAYGIPIITGAPLGYIENSDFCLEFPNDASVVDINKIVEFYKKLREKYTYEEYTNLIRRFAEKSCDIESTMKPVVKLIKYDIDNEVR